MLGVDEFASRAGRTYGTILVDVEAGRVVDVLPDRTSATFAAWLRDHPGAEIICRDRASACTRAIKEAAPGTLEVADRWHLLQNLAAAVEKTRHQHRVCLPACLPACLRKRADEETGRVPQAPPLLQLPLHELPRTPIVDRTRYRYRYRYANVQELVAAGWTISAIARRLNRDRKTVRRFRDTNLDRLLASAHERQSASQGPGSVQAVLEHPVHRESRPGQRQPPLPGDLRTRLPRQPPGRPQTPRRPPRRARRTRPRRHTQPRKITSWIMRPQDTLRPGLERGLLDGRVACPDIDRARDLARTFAELLRHRRGFLLTQWIRQAEQDAPKQVSGFAGSSARAATPSPPASRFAGAQASPKAMSTWSLSIERESRSGDRGRCPA
ncbi:transposase [Streptomyces sp. NPDC056402]|uniref:transposase n=1 Tax=Streptomyces sp. NPDC056402 TaxID=3345810 RepID=UPI0035D8B71A